MTRTLRRNNSSMRARDIRATSLVDLCRAALLADAKDVPHGREAMIVAFLQGKQTPTVEFFGLDADPIRLSATWRVFFDYGAALGDFRAAYKAKGEA